jgi:hypothetical protein
MAVQRWEPTLDVLFDAHLLCEVCQARPWTQPARYVEALVCAGCAEGEPEEVL